MKCNACGHEFETMDMEWNATSESDPAPKHCPECGSSDTRRVRENPLKKIFRKK